jgi:hypothetical protein
VEDEIGRSRFWEKSCVPEKLKSQNGLQFFLEGVEKIMPTPYISDPLFLKEGFILRKASSENSEKECHQQGQPHIFIA